MASVEQFVVLDHHASAVDYCRDAGLRTWDSVADYTADHDYSPQLAILDMNRSGIGVVLEWTTPPLYPQFLLNLEDRDLWRRSLHGTDEVFAAVTSRPYTTEAWDAMANMLWAQLYDEGGAIERYRQNVVAQIVETAYTGHLPNGLEVLMVGCPYALGSDVAGVLAAISPTKVAAYYIDYGTFVKWGLRSTEDGPNVKEIAAECATGGGGHPHAAGFEIRHEDERGGY
jgi:oligoribonuclease NrnB/cAMP/cGMP phosphodiesterase (DHH superfamily)